MAYRPARTYSEDAENGYVVVGKVMIQWGTYTLTTLAAQTMTFHTPFAEAPYHVSLQSDNMGDNVGENNIAVDFSTLTSTGVSINPDDVDHAISDKVRYLVIGKVITN